MRARTVFAPPFRIPSLLRLALGCALILCAASPAHAQASGAARDAQGAERDAQGAASLLTDLERIVTSTESGGWFLDSEAYRSVLPPLLESVCRASSAARSEALECARTRSHALGDPRALFAADGERSARFEQAISAERQQRALEQALARADADCPFWVPARPGFESRQTDHGRWALSVETGGNLQLRRTAGRWTFGGAPQL